MTSSRPRFLFLLARATLLRNSLLSSTLLVVGGIAILVASIFIMVSLSITRQRMESQAKDSLNELIDSMSLMASVACFAKDATLAKETAQSFIRNSYVQRISITGYGQALASAERTPSAPVVELKTGPARKTLTRSLASPFDETETIGSIELTPNWPAIEKAVADSVRHTALMLTLLAGGILGTIAAVVVFRVVRPVKTISDRLHALDAANGEALRIPAHHEHNELGRLVTDINELVARLRSSLVREHELHLKEVIDERQRLLAAVFEHSQEGITITDKENRIVTVNRAFTQITGFSESEVVGKNPNLLASGRHDKAFYAKMWLAINTLGHWKGELWNRCSNGEIKPKWFSINLVRDEAGEVVNHIAVFSDISERKLAEERIEFLAHHDALTKLPNRILTRDRFELAQAGALRDKSGVAMLFIDLDNFKNVNDTLGHQAGDRLLLACVERLKRRIRETDTVSRQGGDEFLIILPGIFKDDTVQRISQKILEELSASFDIDGHVIAISASIGITKYPEDGADFDTLLMNADAAMYAAKSSGKNAYRFFTEEMNTDALEKLQLKGQLSTALENHEFRLVFQPQIDIITQRIIGAEALIRWHHPDYGVVSPGRFIPIAEESGMINAIGDWVIGQACRQGKQWFDAGIPPFMIAVNIAARQFNNAAIVETVKFVLQDTGFPPEYLELEFTESGLLSDINHSLSTIEQLRALGVKMSIDDFGTGYSSLSYLSQFKVDKLKIDQSFVRDMGVNNEGLEIIRAIIQLGKTLQLSVIAEGVETEQQIQTLQELECHQAQGYLICRPLPPADFKDFVNDWNHRHGDRLASDSCA